MKGEPDIEEAANRVAQTQADVLVLLGFDYDYNGVALSAFAKLILESGGQLYPYRFALRPNAGMQTGVDLDMDSRLATPRDAQGYGRFSGEGGMAVLSQFPIQEDLVEDYSDVIWSKLNWATIPTQNGQSFLSPEAQLIQRLSTTGHWSVPIPVTDEITMTLLVYHASPPIFDGPEDRNGLRNADETLFWVHYLEEIKSEFPIVVGDANNDPEKGEGHKYAINELLFHPELQDPFANLARENQVTSNWTGIDLGFMRTDYILPSSNLSVLDQGIIWPEKHSESASRHALVWVDVELPAPKLESFSPTQ